MDAVDTRAGAPFVGVFEEGEVEEYDPSRPFIEEDVPASRASTTSAANIIPLDIDTLRQLTRALDAAAVVPPPPPQHRPPHYAHNQPAAYPPVYRQHGGDSPQNYHQTMLQPPIPPQPYYAHAPVYEDAHRGRAWYDRDTRGSSRYDQPPPLPQPSYAQRMYHHADSSRRHGPYSYPHEGGLEAGRHYADTRPYSPGPPRVRQSAQQSGRKPPARLDAAASRGGRRPMRVTDFMQVVEAEVLDPATVPRPHADATQEEREASDALLSPMWYVVRGDLRVDAPGNDTNMERIDAWWARLKRSFLVMHHRVFTTSQVRRFVETEVRDEERRLVGFLLPSVAATAAGLTDWLLVEVKLNRDMNISCFVFERADDECSPGMRVEVSATGYATFAKRL